MLCLFVFGLTACAHRPVDKLAWKKPSNFDSIHDSAPEKILINLRHVKEPVPKPLPLSRYGNSATYVVRGHTYHVLKSAKGYHVVGIASWYGKKFQGYRTSSGEPYDMFSMTAASTVLPIPCFARVTNLENHRSVIVKVNDRGPFEQHRVMDVSYAAAWKLGMLKHGTARVSVTVIQSIDSKKIVSKLKHLNIKKQKNNQEAKKPMYWIQIGAFSNQQHANALVSKTKKYLSDSVHVACVSKTTSMLCRVTVGPFSSKQQMQKTTVLLKQHGIINPYVYRK